MPKIITPARLPLDLTGQQYTRYLVKRYPARTFACLLCGKVAKDPTDTESAVLIGWDHCHRHGVIRGPLCSWCNSALWLADIGIMPHPKDGQRRRMSRAEALAPIVNYRKRCRWCKRGRLPMISADGAYWASRILDKRLGGSRRMICRERCPVAQWLYGVELVRHGREYLPPALEAESDQANA